MSGVNGRHVAVVVLVVNRERERIEKCVTFN
jgi:hypothetical protein